MALSDNTTLEREQLRKVISIERDGSPLPLDVLQLLKFCSDYYHHPIGEVVLNALPTRLRRRHALKTISAGAFRLTATGRSIVPGELPSRASCRRDLMKFLGDNPSGVDEKALFAIAPSARAALRDLIKLGWVERCSAPAIEPSSECLMVAESPQLTEEQAAAVSLIRQHPHGFAPWVLRGVTGSGKTEVYLRLVADTLKDGGQVLVLVPEINLTPQLESVIRARFPSTHVVSLHSGLSESERLQGWRAAESGTARIVLGTRLAIFTPLPALRLIVVDEEHDTSFKQMEGLRYSARDVALVRAKDRGVPIVLGSATPSLETFAKAESGQYKVAVLTTPVNATRSTIDLIDTKQGQLIDGLSQELLKAVDTRLKRHEQSLIFINRRGFAPVLMCNSCNWTADCLRCSSKLVVHTATRRLTCHHCGHSEPIPAVCTQCGNQDLMPIGQGTQRIESALARLFPTARILRVDRDSTRRKHAWQDMRTRINAREVDILVGTQMLAKGHDFPQLSLVGILNADSSLYSTDFRASERLFARLTQVSGRAGRGSVRGTVLIQTQFPEHPLYRALQLHDYPAYARELLAERRQAGFPPFAYQAVLRAEARDLKTALDFLSSAATAGSTVESEVTIYDPVAAPLVRLAGLERAQLTIEARSRAALHKFLAAWREHLPLHGKHQVRWTLDVDPLEV